MGRKNGTEIYKWDSRGALQKLQEHMALYIATFFFIDKQLSRFGVCALGEHFPCNEWRINHRIPVATGADPTDSLKINASITSHIVVRESVGAKF